MDLKVKILFSYRWNFRIQLEKFQGTYYIVSSERDRVSYGVELNFSGFLVTSCRWFIVIYVFEIRSAG